MNDLEPLTDAERKLLEAVKANAVCDLSRDDDAHRTVRAAFLKAILSGAAQAWGIDTGAAIDLHGAVVSGDLGGFGGNELPPIRLESCRFEDSVDFSEATFTGDALFEKATFTGDALFRKATFTGDALFEKASFTGYAVFTEAAFTGHARFEKATFTGTTAWFHEATFTRDARFDKASFTGKARFTKATFTGDAWFHEAIFTGDAWFHEAIFTGVAVFHEATFTGDAWFHEAIFTGDALFDKAIFAGDAEFNEALAHRLSFSRALFSAPDPGPWIASTISLDRTTLAVRSRISITATKIEASRLQAREGAHLVLHCREVDLSDSEFVRRSIVSSPAVGSTGGSSTSGSDGDSSTAEQIPPPWRRGSQRRQRPRSSESISKKSWPKYRLDAV